MVIDRQQIRYITLRKQIGTQAQVADLTFLPFRPAPFNAVREAQCQSKGKLGWLSRCSQRRLSMRQSAIRLTPSHLSSHFPPVDDLIQKEALLMLT
jgi:hypothetical protein